MGSHGSRGLESTVIMAGSMAVVSKYGARAVPENVYPDLRRGHSERDHANYG